MQTEEDAGRDGGGSMVEVARFESPVEAQMARGMLESAGIECELSGEHANQMITSAFVVQLMVTLGDEEAARELLAKAGEVDGTPEAAIDGDLGPAGAWGGPDLGRS